MDVLPQVSSQKINLPLKYITGKHGGFIVSELVLGNTRSGIICRVPGQATLLSYDEYAGKIILRSPAILVYLPEINVI